MNERDQLQEEIDQTREHLAETVDALTDKLDVKSRAQDAVADAGPARLGVLAAAAVAAVVGIVLIRKG